MYQVVATVQPKHYLGFFFFLSQEHQLLSSSDMIGLQQYTLEISGCPGRGCHGDGAFRKGDGARH